MTEKFNFEEVFNDWNVLHDMWENNTPIIKDEVEILLKKGQVPTQKSMPFLHALFTDNVTYVNRPPDRINRPEFQFIHRQIVFNILSIIKQSKDLKRLKGELTPREKAIKREADYYNISPRQVEGYLTTYKEEMERYFK